MPRTRRVKFRFALGAILTCGAIAMLTPGGAAAATVVNGDFETGTLAGWSQETSSGGEPNGAWVARSLAQGEGEGEDGDLPFQLPAQGSWNAVVDQEGPGTRILFQDIPLEPGQSHRLTLLAYYASSAPLVTPEPNTLDYEGGEGFSPNQQFRIDVIRPTAPIDTLAAGDILATVFATKTGDPTFLAPTSFAADLTAFAGQTVRLRLAEVDNESFLHAQVDSVAIVSTAPAPPAAAQPSNAFELGKVSVRPKNGTARLSVAVPGPGTLRVADVRKKKKRVKAKTVAATAAGAVKLPLQPTGFALKKLNAKGKLAVRVAVTFTPGGGTAATQTKKVVLKLKPAKKRGKKK